MRPNKATRILQTAHENDQVLARHIAALAMAVEAIETLLVAEEVIENGDVTKQLNALIELKKQQMEAK